MKMKKTAELGRKIYLSTDFVRKLYKVDPYIREQIFSFADEIQSIINSGEIDIDELKNIVRKTTEAQKKKERKDRQNEKNSRS